MTQQDFNERCTPEQRQAMRSLQERSGIPWDEFLASAGFAGMAGSQPYVAIPNFHGMYVGIETDGYTHS